MNTQELQNKKELVQYITRHGLVMCFSPENRDQIENGGSLIMRDKDGLYHVFEKLTTPDGSFYCVTEKYEMNYLSRDPTCSIC